MATQQDSPPRVRKRRRLDRVTAACDLCKKRKTKCDGELPCAYCKRKNRANTCLYTSPNVHSQIQSAGHTPINTSRQRSNSSPQRRRSHDGIPATGASISPTLSRDDHHDDTAVPLEGRILRDAQGKVIFIGDCAPLSFLQTVRHLIASKIDSEGFPAQAVRDSIIEVAPTEPGDIPHPLSVDANEVSSLVDNYAISTSGLVDLFRHDELCREIGAWAASSLTVPSGDAAAAASVFYLVLAIGAQESQESKAEAWFRYARDRLVGNMCGSMNVPTVQGFILVAVYMLRAFQPNGAYLYFSLAARAAYAIGLHRTEVNASFGGSIKTVRDRIWKSLRVVDQLISNVLGRPPSTSDVDCTVKYAAQDVMNDQCVNILDASVQIFMIIERVVVEVYSRKRISLRIADYVSRQLKSWATKFLPALSDLTASPISGDVTREQIVGACSTLCSYYYGIMLVTRPFLIYELYDYMGIPLKGGGTQGDRQEKQKYADAALDAAASLLETVQMVILAGHMPHRMPLVVSWLFTAALVHTVSLLGDTGLALEINCRESIRCLDYFGRVDPYARQYSVIVQSLYKVITAYVEKRELQLRLQRKQASSELFGLLPSSPLVRTQVRSNSRTELPSELPISQAVTSQALASTSESFDWTIYDADFFALPWPIENDQGLQNFLQPGTYNLDGASVADIPLFPIYDQ